MESRLASSAARPAQDRKILLADEQLRSRDLVRLVLERLGYGVEAVGSGGEALRRMAARRYDLVLLSSSLPDMRLKQLGRGVAEATLPGPWPPILMIDREGPPEPDDAGSLALRARISRPIDIEQLLRLVRNLLLAAGDEPADDDAAPPILDIDHLASFTDGDSALESEIAALYVSSTEVYLERMHEALAAATPWTRFAHALKGASSNLGAQRVAALALTAERSPPSADQLAALRAAVEEVKTFFATRQS